MSLQNGIKPIETKYAGYRFRSRLEARWAVFFDALGIEWEYEKEGYDLGGIYYLPDFYISELKLWIEIKPSSEISESEKHKIKAFYDALGKNPSEHDGIKVLCGNPWPYKYKVLHGNLTESHFMWCCCPMCGRIDLSYHEVGFDDEGLYCEWCDCKDRKTGETEFAYFYKGFIYSKDGFPILKHPTILYAYQKARATRFEKETNI